MMTRHRLERIALPGDTTALVFTRSGYQRVTERVVLLADRCEQGPDAVVHRSGVARRATAGGDD